MSAPLLRVGLVSKHPLEGFERQAPDGPWQGNGLVLLPQAGLGCEHVVVYDSPAAPLPLNLPPERVWLMVTEPPEVLQYPPAYLAQFGAVLSPYEPPGLADLRAGQNAPRWIATQTALPWMLGQGGPDRPALAYAQLQALPPPAERSSHLSIVCSTKTRTLRHRQRLAAVRALTAALGPRAHLRGRGFEPLDDKGTLILAHRYHLVVENNDLPHFWTEKLADAYLGHALPLFSGCANLAEDFPEQAFIRLPPLDDPAAIIAAVRRVLDEDPYPRHAEAIAQARQRLLTQHNLYPLLARHLHPPGPAAASVAPWTLQPLRAFRGLRRFWPRLLRSAT